ncbi:MAG TPA: hypothetical protein PKA53_01945, partial [Sphingobacterium sp.]|nr:hypothetical protein [Sphingobacterium sp.]
GIGYVELIDPSEKVINSLKIPLVSGIGIGDIPLIDTLTEGSYRIRAYTNWMRNYGAAYFYDRTIHISNGRADDVQTASTVARTDKGDVYSISLKDLAGVPLSKTRVNYQLVKDGEVVSRKRTTTDEQGILIVDVDRKHQGALIKLRFDNSAKLVVNKVIKPINPESNNSVQLLPEGGKILAGTINNIALKAINPKGLGVKATVVLTSKVDTLSVIKTNDLGMGSAFVFIGNNLDTLSGKAIFEDGSSVEVTIPKVHHEGYSIVVNTQHRDRILSQVNLSKQYVNQEELYFVVHHLGQVLFVSKQKANNKELVFAVKKTDLPTGVLTISILNSRLVPIIERPVFNYSVENILPLSVTLNKSSYTARDSVRANIIAGTDQDSMRFSALSASVVNLSKIKEDYHTAPNIFTGLLLDADLRGFIEQPGFYFQDESPKMVELDLLMLTQGWRNIEWDSVGTESKPKFQPEKGIKISGYTKKLGRKAAESNATVQLISTKNFMDYLDTVSNEDGYFEFEELLFPDSIKFLVSARTEKDKKNIDIVVNSAEPPAITANPNAPIEKNDVNSLFLDQINQSKQYFSQLEATGLMEKSIVIEEVVVRARAPKKASEDSSNLNGPGNADQVLNADDLSTCASLDICLAGRLTGVYWQSGVPYNTRGHVPMQVVLDGMFIEAEQVASISPMDIESVEVLRNINYTTVYGMNGGNGLIILTTKRGSSGLSSYVPKGILTIQPQGIHIAKTFYKPEYDVADAIKLSQDLRTTIHWEAGIVSDKEGDATFKFFTSDEKGKYLMVLEGIDLTGRLGRKLVEIEVK